MDPLSAVVVFAGFSASLITILDTICKVSTTLVEFQRKFKDAPRKIVQLHQDMKNLHALVEAIHIRFSGDEGTDYPPTFRAICENFTIQLEHDLREFQTIVNGSNRKPGFPIGKGLKIQTRHPLAESTINEYHQRISMHVRNLTVVQTLINSYKVDNVRQSALEILDETKAILGLMPSHAKALKSTYREDRTRTTPVPKYSTSMQGQGLSSSPNNLSRKRKVFDFGFGLLSFQVIEMSHSEIATQERERYDTQLKASFVPPYWVSRTALETTVWFPGPSHFNTLGPLISLRPMTVNHNPSLLDALHRLDVLKLRHLFETDQARPTDMVIDLAMNEPVSLFEALLRMFVQIIPCSTILSKHMELYSFIIDQGIPLSTEAAIIFFLSMESSWGYDQPQIISGSAEYYLNKLLEHNDISLSVFNIPAGIFVPSGWCSSRYGSSEESSEESIIPTLVEHILGFEGLKRYLFHHSQPWTLEDLSGRGLWYIAVLVHADREFRVSVQAHINGFRSNLGQAEGDSLNSLMGSVLNIHDIVDQVENALSKERCIFMSTLAEKGTPPMLEPFLKSNIDINEGDTDKNYLAIAASERNTQVFRMLLKSGASTARAIPRVCRRLERDNQTLCEQFSELIDNLSSIEGQIGEWDTPDPFITIIESDVALDVRPDAPRLLLENKLALDTRLHGSDLVYPCNSYMFSIISRNRIEVLKLLLEHKPPIDRTIMNMFATDREHFESIANYTWLTLAVELGRSECVKLLLSIAPNQEQAVMRPDGGGRTALRIAQSNFNGSHPRKSVLHGLHWISDQDDTLVLAAEDQATLLIVQAAVSAEATGSLLACEEAVKTVNNNTDLLENSSALTQPVQSSTILYQIQKLRTRAMSVAGELLQSSPRGLSYLHIIIRCHESQCSGTFCKKRRMQTLRTTEWAPLIEMTFAEGLLLRISYVGMLAIVLFHDLVALIFSLGGNKTVSKPFWIVASLLLILVVYLYGI